MTKVSIQRATYSEPGIERLLLPLGGMASFVERGDRVLLKGCTPHITYFFVLKNRLVTDSAFMYMTKWPTHTIFCHIFSSSGLGARF